MNSLMQREGSILRQTQAIRNALMEVLTDDDLAYGLPGDNPTLGGLCVEMGQVERSYIESFKTFRQDFVYAPAAPDMATSVEKLRAWYQELDAELEVVLSGLSEADIQSRMIERGFPVPVGVQFHIYREGQLIFYAKVSVYLKAMQKAMPQQMMEWIG